MIIATDGAHLESNRRIQLNTTSASFVLCSLDIRCNESIETGEWTRRPVIPLLARSSALPTKVGSAASDIAHGECFAFILQELAMCKNFPRITILDSEAVRDQLLNIRNEEEPEIDRKYIRSIAGGISKFFCGILTKKLWVDNLETRTGKNEISNATQWLHNVFKERNERFIRIAESWIGGQDDNSHSSIEGEICTWSRKYFDNHSTRTILKVNSHQLDCTGTKMRPKPRYPTLIPNIALLNANHHADVGADIALRLVKDSSPSWNVHVNLDRPISNIRFFWTWGGKIIDRHISDFLRSMFEKERLKRLISKPTQGLLWRISDQISDTWGSIKNRPGFFRALLGLTNTHTRSLYKSTVYRAGCLEEYLSTINDKETKQAIKNSPVKSQLEYVMKCPWCKAGSHENARKVNRRHCILACDKFEFLQFRKNVSNLLGNKFGLFLKNIKNTVSVAESVSLLYDIEKQFLLLQETQSGRLIKVCKSRNSSYVPISELLHKYQEKSLEDMLSKPNFGTICQDIFGMAPSNKYLTIPDAELGTIDAPWLGLMPKNIDQCIIHNIRRIGKQHLNPDDGTCWVEERMHEWEEIKELNTSRIMGLHRIAKIVGNKRETELIEKFNLSELAEKHHQIRLKRKKATNSRASMKEPATTPAKKPKPNIHLVKQCNGITCGKERLKWCKNATFGRNETRLNRKQCQRCCLFSSAMKDASSILTTMQQCNKTEQTRFINAITKIRSTQRIQYISLMDMLQKYTSNAENFQRAQYTSKNKPNEKCKRVCRSLITAVQHIAANPQECQKPPNIIQNAISLLNKTLSTKEAEIKADNLIMRKYYAEEEKKSKPSPQQIGCSKHCDINKQTLPSSLNRQSNLPDHSISTAPSTHDIIILSDTSNEDMKTKEDSFKLPRVGPISKKKESRAEDPEPSFLRRHKIDVMNRASYLQGIQLLYAIEVLRHTHKESNIFIANPEASEIIDKWEANQGWERFARIFRSSEACFRKPNGLYVIPVFSGDSTLGHWHIIAIVKRGEDRRGYIFDSLGTGCARTRLVTLIETAFAPGRGTVRWVTPASLRQQGVECGPRTIHVMKHICEGFQNTALDPDCLGKATLTSVTNPSEYNQMSIRRQAARIIGSYRPHMVTRSVRARSGR